jgi:hypothetical protein
MSERYGLSRALAEDELPDDATEALEEAGRVDRKPLPGGRAAGSEERAGTEDRPDSEPVAKRRPAFELPPFETPES